MENVNILVEHDLIFLKIENCEVKLLSKRGTCALMILKLYAEEIFDYVLVSGVHGDDHVSVDEGNVVNGNENRNGNVNTLLLNFSCVHGVDDLESDFGII